MRTPEPISICLPWAIAGRRQRWCICARRVGDEFWVVAHWREAVEDASKILHLGERCSRYSRGVYRNEKQPQPRGPGLMCDGPDAGVGGKAGADGDSARSILCKDSGREAATARGRRTRRRAAVSVASPSGYLDDRPDRTSAREPRRGSPMCRNGHSREPQTPGTRWKTGRPFLR